MDIDSDSESGFTTVIWILIAFVFISYIYIELFAFQVNSTDPICKRLYIDDQNREYTVIRNLLTHGQCDTILKEGLDYASKHGWTTKRHYDSPTTDNEILPQWNAYDCLQESVHNVLFPEIAHLYPVQESTLGINEMFLVQYDVSGQSSLEEHEDGSEFSFILALNDDYEGGGTYFVNTDTHIQLKKGECLLFSGQNRHRGEPITRGKRHIVTGFLHYIDNCHCSYRNIDALTVWILDHFSSTALYVLEQSNLYFQS